MRIFTNSLFSKPAQQRYLQFATFANVFRDTSNLTLLAWFSAEFFNDDYDNPWFRGCLAGVGLIIGLSIPYLDHLLKSKKDLSTSRNAIFSIERLCKALQFLNLSADTIAGLLSISDIERIEDNWSIEKTALCFAGIYVLGIIRSFSAFKKESYKPLHSFTGCMRLWLMTSALTDFIGDTINCLAFYTFTRKVYDLDYSISSIEWSMAAPSAIISAIAVLRRYRLYAGSAHPQVPTTEDDEVDADLLPPYYDSLQGEGPTTNTGCNLLSYFLLLGDFLNVTIDYQYALFVIIDYIQDAVGEIKKEILIPITFFFVALGSIAAIPRVFHFESQLDEERDDDYSILILNNPIEEHAQLSPTH